MADINISGLYSDETKVFHSPLEPKAGDIVKIRFRTAKDDVDQVVLVCENQKIILEKETSTQVFDYYITEIVAEDEIIRYYFEVHKNDEVLFIIEEVRLTTPENNISLPSFRVLRHRTGLRERSCIRFIQTVSVTEIRIMM